jgi:hypothetical protein
MGWCQMRELPIHPDLATDLWCHHWTARPPRLPVLSSLAATPPSSSSGNRQLTLAAMLQDI